MQKIIITGANGQLGSELKNIAVSYSDFEFVYTDIDSLDLANSQLVEAFIEKEKEILEI